MPAWWKGKSKGKSKESSKSLAASEPSLSSRPDWGEEEGEEEKGECSSTSKNRREARKEKANSFDGVLLGKKTKEAVSGCRSGDSGSTFAFGHPLPLPSGSSPLPSLSLADSGIVTASGSASYSSVSSSGSSEDTPDLGFYRLSNTINMGRNRNLSTIERCRFSCSPVLEHPRSCEIPLSPRKEIQSSGLSYPETMFNPRTVSCAPSSRGSPISLSPVHPISPLRVHPGSPSGWQEELKSPPHPLPLPPNSPVSPSSLSSRSSQTQWKKGKLLGRGTFGHVYLGFNSESGQMCAVKEVKVISDDSISRESLKQLNQEINLLRQLSHPNIVQYYGSELVDETLAVYLEYVSGGSIHKLLQEYGSFGEPVIRNYTAQILSGLAYLHGRNTVHRDIKGANILVDPNGEVKLADFGMAKHISSYTSIRSFKGSPYWMAPEVIMNGSGYNLSVDIWSLGCTVLEMATSKPPWSQFEGVAAIFKIGNSKDIPAIPDHLSSEAKSFLRLCLLRDPSARPTAAQLIYHPFVCDQSTIKATKSSTMDMLSTSSDGTYSMDKGFHINKSASSVFEKDYGIGRPVTNILVHKNPSCSDLTGMRANISLPNTRCSSPLRQCKQCNRSCLPSPTHPALSAGAHQSRPSNLPDYSLDIAELKNQSPYHWQRR
ncbi:hypothetical protein KFK09_024491 [Dendrobium nobile]|uniref:mitogen-activated protein kinase kinase kinase n=1 Tax=Dendrobium nobile TaxID=94219 RepID=A0A8T3AD74_DENNO|nr:hypothetical protein KFK09_024491 [Dendrobium nobile]